MLTPSTARPGTDTPRRNCRVADDGRSEFSDGLAGAAAEVVATSGPARAALALAVRIARPAVSAALVVAARALRNGLRR